MEDKETERPSGEELQTEVSVPDGESSLTEEEVQPKENVAAENDGADAEIHTVERPKKKKYGWLGYVLLLAAIALGIYLMLQVVYDLGDDVKSFGDVVRASDWRFVVITIAVLLIIFICQWLQYAVIIKTTTGKFHLVTGLKVAFVGKFYDNITPFSTGGQPMQIYYLNKKGMKGGTASAVVMIKYFAWMFCWVLICMLFMACCTGTLVTYVPNSSSRLYMLIMGWIGLAINVFLPLLVILFVVLPKFSKALVRAVIGIGHKLKIIKNPVHALYKIERIVHDFRSSFKIMSKSPIGFISLILLCSAEILLSFAFPYFVMKMFSALTAADGLDVMISVTAINIYAAMSVCIIPTPGNSGAIEAVVTAAFASVAESVLLWTVLAWRFGMYYIYILIGLVMTLFDFFIKIVKNKKQNKANRKII